jgi:CRISPR-associated endonuclease/helicase Cas3
MDFNSSLFWAKTTDDKIDPKRENAFHPLICHLIDVAMTARTIWENVLTETQKKRLAKPFGLENNLREGGNLLAFLVGLHDLGKCSPPFALRGKHKPESEQTRRLYQLYKDSPFDMDSFPPASEARHEFVTSIVLPIILEKKFGFQLPFAKKVSDIIGGHHGNFPTTRFQNEKKNLKEVCGTPIWSEVRNELVEKLATALKIKEIVPTIQNKEIDNATAMIFAGFVTAADWVGSNADFFKCEIADSTKIDEDENFPVNAAKYLKKSQRQALNALEELGWLDWVSVTAEKKFEELFPLLQSPRYLQIVAQEIAKELDSVGIVVVEEQMGEGKTETAMFLADVFNAVLKQRGIYFALPTQATSNQMFGRVKNFLDARYSSDERGKAILNLHHGHASINAEFEELKQAGVKQNSNGNNAKLTPIFDDSQQNSQKSKTIAEEWFTFKKRGLFVPFGVGTIDQILLGVLQVKHVFVRLFGLAHKTIVIDEVHAYDAYMSTLLERLLEWLAALGSPVIILSATLSKNRRDALIKAYLKGLGRKLEDEDKLESIGERDAYPRISYATANTQSSKFNIRHLGFPEREAKTLHLEWKDRESFVKELVETLKPHGGCVAVICNTVKEAQETYERLRDDPFFQDNADDGLPKLDLLHARFRFKDRDEREKRALLRFGKKGEKVSFIENGEKIEKPVVRPNCAVLVSTQIIEQSLDLDFDLMISEHAPADLLLQRSGRLQRHKRDRFDAFKLPILWILKPELNEHGNLLINSKNEPDFGTNGIVYDRHILLRSWLKLRNCKQIVIPNDIEDLIESVYDKNRKCFDEKYLDAWEETKISLERKLTVKRQRAKAVYLTDFDDEDIFNSFTFALDEDDPEKHSTLRAQTRDDERPSVAVILLTRKEADSVDLEKEPTRKIIEFLMVREVKFSRFGLTQEILNNPKYKQSSWSKSALLRHHRLVILEENDELAIGKYKIILDKRHGVIFKKAGENE